MTRNKRLVLGTISMLAWSCGNGVPQRDNGGVAPRVAVQVNNIESLDSYRVYSGMSVRERHVIRDRAAWESVWARVASATEPRVSAPVIDFAQWMVVLVSAGSRSSGGHSIEIKRVADSGSELIVEVEELSPGADCMTTQALSAPLHGILVPQRAGPVRFVELQRAGACG